MTKIQLWVSHTQWSGFLSCRAPLGLVEMLPHLREEKGLLGSWDTWPLAASVSQTKDKMVGFDPGAQFKSLLLISLLIVILYPIYSTLLKCMVFLLARLAWRRWRWFGKLSLQRNIFNSLVRIFIVRNTSLLKHVVGQKSVPKRTLPAL